MQVEEELARFRPEKDTLLTIGVFDGVHLGHKFLLSQLKEKAGRQNLLCGVITFRQHPVEVLSPGARLPLLTDAEEKASLLKSVGIDIVVTLNFTQELARLSARQFVSLLKDHLRMRGVVIGPDFAMGQNRTGSVETLKKLGQEMGFSVDVVSPMKINGLVASSTAIRKAIADGDMDKVHRLLGRYFSVRGQVVPGDRRGVTLGFPTANLDADSKQALPPDGIYATIAHINGRTYHSVTNVGKRPTFGGSKRTVEIHVLDFQDDLYGKEIRVEFIEWLRGEKRFDNVEELKKQIFEDIKRGKAVLAEKKELL